MITYHVAYSYTTKIGWGFGRASITLDREIRSGTELAAIEKELIRREGRDDWKCVVLSWAQLDTSDEPVTERAVPVPEKEPR